MNLAELRQRVFDQMDFNPDLQQYRDSVVRRLNDHYLRISDSAHWLFLQKETKIALKKEIEGVAATTTITVSSTNTRFVQVSGFTATKEMEGQTLIDTTNNKEHTIIRVYNALIIFIKDNWTGTTGSATGAFKIRFDRQKLPADCVEVMGYIDREADRGRLYQVSKKAAEYAYLDRDNTGDPLVIVDDDSFFGLAPINKPSLALGSTGVGGTIDLLDNTEYEYFYTLKAEGREGPPSEKVSIKTGTGSKIVISNLDDTRHYTESSKTITFQDSGISKFLYRRDKTNNGPTELIQILEATTTSHDDDQLFYGGLGQDAELGLGTTGSVVLTSPADKILYNQSGPRQHVRFWYTPSLDKNIDIRYHYRPPRLVSDHDAPIWPVQYHHILVYAVLEDMFLQMQATDQASVFRLRGEELMVQMRKRYLTRDEDRKRFQRFDRPRRFRVYGPASSVFGGADPNA